MHDTETTRERAILVGIDRQDSPWSLDSSLDELERLVDTAGADVVARTSQRITAPNPKTFVGTGKAREIAEMATAYSADIIVFDEELSPSQQTNLERIVDKSVKVIDRTALILDIFGLHATTKEGRLQVRLAQNQYLYPRLRGMWAHLASNKMGGGVGSRFGEGESQLEVDRRMVRKRITSIKRELAQLEKIRAVQRETRYTGNTYRIALAGYTNAGKSSLLNRLTDADVLSYDKLFATLDATTRKLKLPEGREVTLTDTVGFIRKLPTTLVESFKSTLDEINGSNLILHVVDISSIGEGYHMRAVEEVLEQIGAANIERLLVFNKCDLVDQEIMDMVSNRFENAIFISATTGFGIDALIERIAECAARDDGSIEVVIPYTKGDLVSVAHRTCRILSEEHIETGTHLKMLVPVNEKHLFEPYVQTGASADLNSGTKDA